MEGCFCSIKTLLDSEYTFSEGEISEIAFQTLNGKKKKKFQPKKKISTKNKNFFFFQKVFISFINPI